MFDIGWTELVLIGVVALIVIGPQDLPDMFRQLGRFTAKLRAMARDFQRAMDQAAKESGAGDVAKDLKNLASPQGLGLNAVRQAADKFEKWDPLKPAPAAKAAMAPAEAPAAPPPASPAAATVEGPATLALRQKQAQRKAILRETADKLKAVSEADTLPAPAKSVRAKAASAKPARKAAARPEKPAAEIPVPQKTAAKPRRKKTDQA